MKIAASSVNPIDTYIRSGAVALATEFPYIPGCDLAGTVEAVGEGGSRRCGRVEEAASVRRGAGEARVVPV